MARYLISKGAKSRNMDKIESDESKIVEKRIEKEECLIIEKAIVADEEIIAPSHIQEADLFSSPVIEPKKQQIEDKILKRLSIEKTLMPLEKLRNVQAKPRFAHSLGIDLTKLPKIGSREFKLPSKLPPLKPRLIVRDP